MTRYGMRPDDFRALAALLAKIIRGRDEAKDAWRGEVTRFRERFTTMRYCF